MSSLISQRPTSIIYIFCLALLLALAPEVRAEEEETDSEQVQETTSTRESQRSTTIKKTEKTEKKKERRKFITDHPERIDAGIFYVAAAIGGNFYVEPRYNALGSPSGDYFNDFGFQGGVYFDYDYSQLTENVPLMLRGFVGYKYILNSVHCFSFDGMVRRQMQVSENVTFGVGMGGSAAIWLRKITTTSLQEENLFLPSLLIGAGFEFNPFMVDFKWLINRLGGDNTIMGLEMYFGFRL